MQIIVDSNIKLDLLSEKYTEELFLAIDQNRAHLASFLPWVSNMLSIENAQNYIEYSQQLYHQGKEISFLILFDHQLIGRIGLHHIDDQNKNASIGYWLTQKFQGKGIVSAACKKIISFGFEKINLQRIEIKAAVNNTKSKAIPEKLGFKHEGILRQAEFVNHQFHDLSVYSILKHEWVCL